MTESGADIGICAFGGLTPVGLEPNATAASVRCGISGFAEHPFYVDRSGDRVVVAAVPGLDVDSRLVDRLQALTDSAYRQVTEVLMAHFPNAGKTQVFIGQPAVRPGLSEQNLMEFSGRLQEHLMVDGTPAEMIPSGHAAGLLAIGRCADSLARGRIEIGIAGGVDSYLEPETLEWLEIEERLLTPENPWGFIPGEAAGFCLMTTRKIAEGCGVPFLVKLAGFGEAREPHPLGSNGVCTGQGLTSAIRQAVEREGGIGAPIDQTLCDMNG